MSAIAKELENIVGIDGICAWETLNEQQQKPIKAAIADQTPQSILYPATPAQLAEVMKVAAHHRQRVLPCGKGSKLNWGNFATGIDLIISTARLNQLIEHAVGDLTVTVMAGMPFHQLQATLAQAGQFLALDPTYPESATIGGIVATGDTGSLRQRYGSVRDQLIGLSFVRADGQMAKAGGRVVKNVAGYDLMKLFTGAYGTLGILSMLTFRVYPLPAASQTLLLTGDETAIAQLTQTLLASALTPTAIDLLSPECLRRLQLGSQMGLLLKFESVPQSVQQQCQRVLDLGTTYGLKGVDFENERETDLWAALKKTIHEGTGDDAIVGKIGIKPTDAIALLQQMDDAVAQIHAGSGLGRIRLSADAIESVKKARSHCQSAGGFLTILSAPTAVKQTLDVWGYPGNALPLMRTIKQEFDPDHLLSPHRFVGNI